MVLNAAPIILYTTVQSINEVTTVVIRQNNIHDLCFVANVGGQCSVIPFWGGGDMVIERDMVIGPMLKGAKLRLAPTFSTWFFQEYNSCCGSGQLCELSTMGVVRVRKLPRQGPRSM